MENVVIKITEDEFYEKYKRVKNHLDDNASWDGCLYETFGDELQYCFELAKKENRVWTIVECDEIDFDGDDDDDDDDDEIYEPTCFYILSGFHYVNRIGFFVTEKEYKQDTEVKLDF
jgi:hypothetical protein